MALTDSEIVTDRVRRFQSSEDDDLNLFGLRIDEVPPEIFRISGIKTLSLEENELESLPPEIGNMESLEDLSLSNNKLKFLPEELGKLEKLKVLRIDHNNLRTLPDSLRKLKGLRKLSIGGNELCNLPLEKSQIDNLLWTDVSDSVISKLAESDLANDNSKQESSTISIREDSQLWGRDSESPNWPPEATGDHKTIALPEIHISSRANSPSQPRLENMFRLGLSIGLFSVPAVIAAYVFSLPFLGMVSSCVLAGGAILVSGALLEAERRLRSQSN